MRIWKVDKKSGALVITWSNSMKLSFPSPSTSASSTTFSTICAISSGCSSCRVSNRSAWSRSAGPICWSPSKSNTKQNNQLNSISNILQKNQSIFEYNFIWNFIKLFNRFLSNVKKIFRCFGPVSTFLGSFDEVNNGV